jgi:hypothetical protein
MRRQSVARIPNLESAGAAVGGALVVRERAVCPANALERNRRVQGDPRGPGGPPYKDPLRWTAVSGTIGMNADYN